MYCTLHKACVLYIYNVFYTLYIYYLYLGLKQDKVKRDEEDTLMQTSSANCFEQENSCNYDNSNNNEKDVGTTSEVHSNRRPW